MENSLAMRVSNRARDFCHHLYTLASIAAEFRCRRTKTPTRCVFHAEIRQAILAFADIVNRKNVWMIEARDRFGFAPEAHQRLV